MSWPGGDLQRWSEPSLVSQLRGRALRAPWLHGWWVCEAIEPCRCSCLRPRRAPKACRTPQQRKQHSKTGTGSRRPSRVSVLPLVLDNQGGSLSSRDGTQGARGFAFLCVCSQGCPLCLAPTPGAVGTAGARAHAERVHAGALEGAEVMEGGVTQGSSLPRWSQVWLVWQTWCAVDRAAG